MAGDLAVPIHAPDCLDCGPAPAPGQIRNYQYTAPEVIAQNFYGKPCDIWGAGILLHVLLSGRLPYLGSGHRLTRLITNNNVMVRATAKPIATPSVGYIIELFCIASATSATFHPFYLFLIFVCVRWVIQLNTPEWRSVSANAKDLVLKMLAPDPDARITVDQVLNHPWLRVSVVHLLHEKQPNESIPVSFQSMMFSKCLCLSRTAKICQKPI